MGLHEGTICSTDADAAAPPRRSPFVLAIAANVVAMAVFTVSPHAAEYPVAALGIAAFLLAQLLLPACRPVRESPFCPGNVAQAFFWVQLVLGCPVDRLLRHPGRHAALPAVGGGDQTGRLLARSWPISRSPSLISSEAETHGGARRRTAFAAVASP